jgi:hypothetical protein
MGEVAFAKLLLVDVIINIDSFSSHITPQLLHEVSGHTASDKVGDKPVATAVRGEFILKLARIGII